MCSSDLLRVLDFFCRSFWHSKKKSLAAVEKNSKILDFFQLQVRVLVFLPQFLAFKKNFSLDFFQLQLRILCLLFANFCNGGRPPPPRERSRNFWLIFSCKTLFQRDWRRRRQRKKKLRSLISPTPTPTGQNP